jgi:Tol biopolymer transport system component
MQFVIRYCLLSFALVLLVLTFALHDARQEAARSSYWLSYAAKNDEVTNLYTTVPGTNIRLTLAEDVGFTHRMNYSPDGQWLVFDSRMDNPNGDVYRLRVLDGSEPERLTESQSSFAPNWSPNGKQIAFIANWGSFGVYTMSPDGSNVRRVSDSNYLGRVSWSPDGEWLAYSSDQRTELAGPPDGLAGSPTRPPPAEIYRLHLASNQPERLTRSDFDNYSPVWSPDGSQIAFVSDRGFAMSVFIMNADGSNLRQITPDNVFDGAPQWSPDGKWLAFVSDRGGDTQVHVMRSDGTDVQQVVHGFEESWAPAWTPVLELPWTGERRVLGHVIGNFLLLIALEALVVLYLRDRAARRQQEQARHFVPLTVKLRERRHQD